MKLSIQAGSTSQTVNIFIQDSSSVTGAGLAGLVYNTASLTAYYALSRAAAVSITLATLAAVTSAYSSGGFKEIDATNMPGWYRFDIPDAALASGRFVGFLFKGATNMAPLPIEIELTAWNNQDSVRAGLTALPNAAAEAAGGLYTSGSGAGQIKQSNNGQIDVNAARLGGTTQTGRDVGASVLVGDKTGFLLSAAGINAIWDQLLSAITTGSSIGKLIKDDLDATISSRLAPTTAGRTLDVTATGAGGIDWANVENPGSVVDLVATGVGWVDGDVYGNIQGSFISAITNNARGEPGQGAPPASATMAVKVDWLYKLMRNKIEQTSTTLKIYDDAGTTVDSKATVSDDGTTFTRGEIGSGP